MPASTATDIPDPPSVIVRKLLIDYSLGADIQFNSVGTYAGSNWPVFTDVEPATPDNCITVFDTMGMDQGTEMNTGAIFGPVGVQIRIRSKDKPTGWTRADRIYAWMCREVYQATVSIGANRYEVHCFADIGNVLSLGLDSPNTKRSLHTVNGQVHIKKTN